MEKPFRNRLGSGFQKKKDLDLPVKPEKDNDWNRVRYEWAGLKKLL